MTYWNGSAWQAEPPASPPRPTRGRRLLGAATEASLITLLIFGLIAGTALAAKGEGKGGGKPAATPSTVAPVLVLDADGDGVTSYGDTVSFTASAGTTADTLVGFRCWQGSSFVFDGYVPLFESWASKNLTLTSTNWDVASGADCHARLFYYDNRARERVLATTQVTVAP